MFDPICCYVMRDDLTLTPNCVNNVSATTTGSDTELTSYYTPVDIVIVVWMSAATLTTIVGNVAICWIIQSTPALQTTHNKFVLNLAWCDLLMAVTNGPSIIVALLYDDWLLGPALCQVNGLLMTLFGIASVLTLAVISINRSVWLPSLFSMAIFVIYHGYLRYLVWLPSLSSMAIFVI